MELLSTSEIHLHDITLASNDCKNLAKILSHQRNLRALRVTFSEVHFHTIQIRCLISELIKYWKLFAPGLNELMLCLSEEDLPYETISRIKGLKFLNHSTNFATVPKLFGRILSLANLIPLTEINIEDKDGPNILNTIDHMEKIPKNCKFSLNFQ